MTQHIHPGTRVGAVVLYNGEKLRLQSNQGQSQPAQRMAEEKTKITEPSVGTEKNAHS